MAKLELERGTDVLLLETGDALLLEGILDYPISLSPGLTASVTIAAVWGRLITTVANLTVNSVVARFITYTRATTSNLTASVTLSRAIGYVRDTASNLTAAVRISRVVAYVRSISAGLTTAVTVVRVLGRTISTTANLTVSVLIRWCVVLREIARVPLSRMSTVITPVARMVTKRLSPSRLSPWRRRKSCDDD